MSDNEDSQPIAKAMAYAQEVITLLGIPKGKIDSMDIEAFSKGTTLDDPSTATAKELNAWVLERAYAYSLQEDKVDEEIMAYFQEDFENWTSEHFGRVNSDYRRALRTILTVRGIYLGKPNARINQKLEDLVNGEDLPKWDEDELEKQKNLHLDTLAYRHRRELLSRDRPRTRQNDGQRQGEPAKNVEGHANNVQKATKRDNKATEMVTEKKPDGDEEPSNGDSTVAILADQATLHECTRKDVFNVAPQGPAQTFRLQDRCSTVLQGSLPDTGAVGISTARVKELLAPQREMPTGKITLDTSVAGLHRVHFGDNPESTYIATVAVDTQFGIINFHAVSTNTPLLLCMADMDGHQVWFNNVKNVMVHEGKHYPVIRRAGLPPECDLDGLFSMRKGRAARFYSNMSSNGSIPVVRDTERPEPKPGDSTREISETLLPNTILRTPGDRGDPLDQRRG
jgi:hypothetical protein